MQLSPAGSSPAYLPVGIRHEARLRKSERKQESGTMFRLRPNADRWALALGRVRGRPFSDAQVRITSAPDKSRLVMKRGSDAPRSSLAVLRYPTHTLAHFEFNSNSLYIIFPWSATTPLASSKLWFSCGMGFRLTCAVLNVPLQC